MRRIPDGPIARESVGYLRRIPADRAAEGEAREGNGALRTRLVRGAERAADLTATTAAAVVRDKDAISSPPCLLASVSKQNLLELERLNPRRYLVWADRP